MDQKLPRLGRDTLNEPLADVLVSQVLRREAESKIVGTPATQPTGGGVVATGNNRSAAGIGTIAARPDGSYRLEAAASRVVGQMARLDGDFIAHWNDAKDYVTWNI